MRLPSAPRSTPAELAPWWRRSTDRRAHPGRGGALAGAGQLEGARQPFLGAGGMTAWWRSTSQTTGVG
jgi:hypothetical protein